MEGRMMKETIKVMLWLCDFMSKKKYNKVILTSGADRLQFNTKYLFEFLLEQGEYEVKYVINSGDERKKLTQKYGDHFIGNKSFRERLEILKSGVWITDTIAPVYKSLPNSKRVFINLWHGIPLKTVGIPHEKKVTKKVLARYKKHSKQYTYFIVPSEELRELYKKSFLLPDSKVKILGQVRNDKINDPVNLKNYFEDISKTSKNILYVPTWREEETLFFPFENFSYDELEGFLEENKMTIFIKGHQFEKGLAKIKEGKRIRVIRNEIEDIMEIINGFDMIITDYSSVYFDYLLTEKPIVFLPYDLDEYSKKRGFNFEYDEVTPGPKPKNFKEFKRELKKLLSEEEYYKDSRKKVNSLFNEVKENNLEKTDKLIKEAISKIS